MNIRKRLTVGAVAAATSIGVALSGAAVIAPADAAQRQEPVLTRPTTGYQSTAYGTRVTSEVAGLDSTRSAFSYLSAPASPGRSDDETLARRRAPRRRPLHRGRGHRRAHPHLPHKADDIAGAVTEHQPDRQGPPRQQHARPELDAQRAPDRSTAWATLGGKLKTVQRDLVACDISLVDLPDDVPPELQGPLDDLLGAVDGGIDQVLQALIDNGNMIEIPGLGHGQRRLRPPGHAQASFAAASSFVLRVKLFGAGPGRRRRWTTRSSASAVPGPGSTATCPPA